MQGWSWSACKRHCCTLLGRKKGTGDSMEWMLYFIQKYLYKNTQGSGNCSSGVIPRLNSISIPFCRWDGRRVSTKSCKTVSSKMIVTLHLGTSCSKGFQRMVEESYFNNTRFDWNIKQSPHSLTNSLKNYRIKQFSSKFKIITLL